MRSPRRTRSNGTALRQGSGDPQTAAAAAVCRRSSRNIAKLFNAADVPLGGQDPASTPSRPSRSEKSTTDDDAASSAGATTVEPDSARKCSSSRSSSSLSSLQLSSSEDAFLSPLPAADSPDAVLPVARGEGAPAKDETTAAAAGDSCNSCSSYSNGGGGGGGGGSGDVGRGRGCSPPITKKRKIKKMRTRPAEPEGPATAFSSSPTAPASRPAKRQRDSGSCGPPRRRRIVPPPRKPATGVPAKRSRRRKNGATAASSADPPFSSDPLTPDRPAPAPPAASPSLSLLPALTPAPTPPRSLVSLKLARIAPEEYVLPELLRSNGGLVPPLAALIKRAAEHYSSIFDMTTNPMAEYLPGNSVAWQTFVATPTFQLRLADVEAAAAVAGAIGGVSAGREQNGGQERSEPHNPPPLKGLVVDVKAEAKALCKFLWSSVLQMKGGGEQVTVAGILARIGIGYEVGKEQAAAAGKFAWEEQGGEGEEGRDR